MKKIFVVGCPRSGTTLLQSILASHPYIVSFPETHLLSKTISINPFVQMFTVYRTKHYNKVEQILAEFKVKDTFAKNHLPPIFFTKSWVDVLLPRLDSIAETYRSGQEHILLEKTPRHLHFIDLIQNSDANALIIHVIRRGEDVVASLAEATSEHPDKWSGNRSISKSIFWWNRSIKISKKYIRKPGNVHILYENLVDHSQKTLQFLCDQIGIKFQQSMLQKQHKTARDLIQTDEKWKAKNTSPTLSGSEKFTQLSPAVQDKIRHGLVSFDYKQIDIRRN